MKKILFKIIVITVGIAALFALSPSVSKNKQNIAAADPKNAEYMIEGERVKLKNGITETAAAPDSASKVVTRYFGNEFVLDLNDDGREDTVFLLTQETGGTGTFYYVVAALNTERGYIGSEALLLGDRVAPQTTKRRRGKMVIVNYADRALTEP